MSFEKLDENELATLKDTASYLQVDPSWLYDVIDHESGWDAQARNSTSGARGLIQWLPSTARGMGFASADAMVNSYPDRISQLKTPVLTYLFPYAPFPTQQSIAMAVFYPDYRAVSPDTVFPADVQNDNPGIVKVSDYLNLVFRGSGINSLLIAGGILAALVGVYFLSQRGFFRATN
jgi:hypothetical protein